MTDGWDGPAYDPALSHDATDISQPAQRVTIYHCQACGKDVQVGHACEPVSPVVESQLLTREQFEAFRAEALPLLEKLRMEPQNTSPEFAEPVAEPTPLNIKPDIEQARAFRNSKEMFAIRWKRSHPDSLMSSEDLECALMADFAASQVAQLQQQLALLFDANEERTHQLQVVEKQVAELQQELISRKEAEHGVTKILEFNCKRAETAEQERDRLQLEHTNLKSALATVYSGREQTERQLKSAEEVIEAFELVVKGQSSMVRPTRMLKEYRAALSKELEEK